MRYLTGAIAFALVVVLPLPASANLDEMYDALFGPTAVKMPFRINKEKDGEQETICTGSIYYSQGDLFVHHDSGRVCNWATPNLATINGNLYFWEPDQSEGGILTRFSGDTAKLVEYFVDPSAIKTSFYYDQGKAPEKYTLTELDGITVIQPTVIEYGFGGIELTHDPLWIRSLVMYGCDELVCQREMVEQQYSLPGELPVRWVSEIDAPIAIDSIPDDLKVLPEGVTFTPVETTADWFMTYL